MHVIDTIYINGRFVTPHGDELFDLHNPATAEIIGQVRLGDAEDANQAVSAAKAALPAFSRTSKAERLDLLRRLNAAILARADDLTRAVITEYGGPIALMAQWTQMAARNFLSMAQALEGYAFERTIGTARVVMQPVGVVAVITPWNSNIGFITSKLATAIAAGCTIVVKPSEMSATQTQVLLEAIDAADLPAGVFNLVNGRGDVVGAALTGHHDVAKVSFTGSTVVGKSIMRTGAETLKRVTLELGGKSPTILLDDADFATAIPTAITAAFMNSGQACIAGTRLLVPQSRYDEAARLAAEAVSAVVVRMPNDPESRIGPMVSQKQYERVQSYIRKGIDEGATLLAGGEGHPHGLEGYFVRPTLFGDVRNDMTIAREEIFGPVLSLIAYRDDDDAVAIANDTPYGLAAYVLGGDLTRAHAVAARIDAGRVMVNGLHHEPLAPFGGFKQSGIGREYGVFGLETHLEAKAVIVAPAA